MPIEWHFRSRAGRAFEMSLLGIGGSSAARPHRGPVVYRDRVGGHVPRIVLSIQFGYAAVLRHDEHENDRHRPSRDGRLGHGRLERGLRRADLCGKPAAVLPRGRRGRRNRAYDAGAGAARRLRRRRPGARDLDLGAAAGWLRLIVPVNAILIAGLALAKVRFDQYVRFIAPLMGILLVIILAVLLAGASF